MWAEGGEAIEGRPETGLSAVPGATSATVLAFPNDDQMRLRRALASLDTAMAEQRRAVAEWRAALGELSQSVGSLGGALLAQDQALGALASDVAGLNAEANRLVAWSDSALGANA